MNILAGYLICIYIGIYTPPGVLHSSTLTAHHITSDQRPKTRIIMDQGWILVWITSCITFLGCCVIYTDVLYAFFFPKRATLKPFHISKDTNFLICSLALSSGSLLFTSLSKLLPKAGSYLGSVPRLHDNYKLLTSVQYGCYMLGILICSLLNLIIHLMTSESLVHCAHDDVEGAGHNHGHGHGHGHSHAAEDHNHNHTTEDQNHSHHSVHSHTHNHSHGHSDPPYGSTPSSHNQSPLEEHKLVESPESLDINHVETKLHDYHPSNAPANPQRPPVATLHNELDKRKTMSLMDLSLKKLKGETMTGECFGDIKCFDDILLSNKLHKTHNGLHFCSKPSEENLLFFPDDHNNRHMITDRNEFYKRYPTLDIQSPLISNSQPNYSSFQNSNDETFSHNKLNSHHDSHDVHFHDNDDLDDSSISDDEEIHHHHIKTPLSRLLSIGLQTILAISLHKFPEGFIMYATSKSNPELGMSIFLSMFIHNFVEGFTMTLPLYIALNSRLKALLISGTLGGLSQPVGAMIGYFMFRGSPQGGGGGDDSDGISVLLIAVLLAITSGFLTFIALQMFASAIGFGGGQEKVMKWCFVGITLICLSDLI